MSKIEGIRCLSLATSSKLLERAVVTAAPAARLQFSRHQAHSHIIRPRLSPIRHYRCYLKPEYSPAVLKMAAQAVKQRPRFILVSDLDWTMVRSLATSAAGSVSVCGFLPSCSVLTVMHSKATGSALHNTQLQKQLALSFCKPSPLCRGRCQS